MPFWEICLTSEGAMHQITQITQTLCQASGKTEPCRQPSRLPGLGRSGGHRRAARTVVGVVLPFIKSEIGLREDVAVGFNRCRPAAGGLVRPERTVHESRHHPFGGVNEACVVPFWELGFFWWILCC